MDWHRDMVSYKLENVWYFEYLNPLEFLRLEFQNGISGGVIPAVYCSDYYKEEIEAEKNGTSTLSFYIDNYDDTAEDRNGKSICPNMTKTTTVSQNWLDDLMVNVVPCKNR